MHTTTRRKPRSLGQIVVIFAISVIAFVGLCAVVIDVSWFWASSLRIQRAADAAALAGVIRLPADVTGAVSLARAEAKKNGYENGVNGVTVSPTQDPINHRRLRVTVSADVGTFFARVLGLNSFHTSRTSKAEYVLPVPMGSPENYYGIFGTVRHCANTTSAPSVCQQANGYTTFDDVHTPTVRTTDTGWLNASATKGTVPGTWLTTGNVYTSDNSRATTTTNNAATAWGNFGITFPATVSSIDGIELSLEVSRDNATSGTNCTFNAALSWDNGTTYTTGAGTGLKSTPALTNTDTYRPLPTTTPATDKWNRATWTASQMSDAMFRVRITAIKATTATCPAAQIMRIDHIRIKVYYRWIEDVVTNPPVFHPDTAVAGPQAQVLTARGFWGMMLSQGAETISGDAYLPFYDTAGSGTNANYDTLNYYNYAIEMAAGSTGGTVWIYDPGFCAGALGTGVGDTWISGSNAMSSYYDLFDTMGTPYDLIDDVPVAGMSSGIDFKNQNGSDPSLNGSGGSGIAGCDAYHLGWYQLGGAAAPGLSGGANGHVYRLHTSTTDPSNINAQKSTQARNGWALFTKVASGTAPRIYGIGAMEMYTPLTSPSASEFYLAQIEAAHAGKTMEIKLFDAGDTNGDANLQILIPTATGWTPTNFNYTASVGTTKTGSQGPSACGSLTGTNVPSVTTYASGSSRFNGCWITIQIPIPTTYTAPQTGWWKIRYNMTGSGSGATDITTWQVQIRGNPVHLILP